MSLDFLSILGENFIALLMSLVPSILTTQRTGILTLVGVSPFNVIVEVLWTWQRESRGQKPNSLQKRRRQPSALHPGRVKFA